VRDAAAEGFTWSYAGRHRLKGVSALLPLYRAHRLNAPAIADEARWPAAAVRVEGDSAL
jgi:class 3 adenylate cyclase